MLFLLIILNILLAHLSCVSFVTKDLNDFSISKELFVIEFRKIKNSFCRVLLRTWKKV